MSDDLDYNKIVAELIQNYLKATAAGFAGGSESVWKSLQNKLKISYSKYLKAAVKKYSKSKTILYREKAVPLYEFYEHVRVKCGNRTLETNDIEALFEVNDRLIVTGTAGSGKSTLLKHLFLNSLTKKKSIPIFVELRNLNNYSGLLLDFMYDTVYELGFVLEKEYFLKSLVAGEMVIFFDGYDEIRNDLKPSLTTQILQITNTYSKNRFIVSSRPDDEFVSWNDFTELRALPLDKDQACRLVAKLNYDEVVKGKFLDQLKTGLYDKHKDFLSIPLLLTIMLMTFGQNADIPNKMHIFYSQVFDTLFNKHDATKAVYRRKMFTALAIDDFKTVLSAFSILSYSKHTTVFSYEEAILFLAKAKRITNIGFKEDAFLKDLLKSVCVLNQEGLLYTYTHKTFQEFFSAIYISRAKSDVQSKLLETLDWDINRNKVLQMLFEMDSDLIECRMILPRLEKIARGYNITTPASEVEKVDFIKHLYAGMVFHGDGNHTAWAIENLDDFHFCNAMKRLYPKLTICKTWMTDQQQKMLRELKPELQLDVNLTLMWSKLKDDTRVFQILLSEPITITTDLEFLRNLWQTLKKKHQERARSIEEILFEAQ